MSARRLAANQPVGQEQRRNHKQRTAYGKNPVRVAASAYGIPDRNSGEEYCADPFPAPRHDQDEDYNRRRDEMKAEGQGGLPEASVLAEHVQSKHAQEQGKSDAERARRPVEQNFSSVRQNDHLPGSPVAVTT